MYLLLYLNSGRWQDTLLQGQKKMFFIIMTTFWLEAFVKSNVRQTGSGFYTQHLLCVGAGSRSPEDSSSKKQHLLPQFYFFPPSEKKEKHILVNI